MHRCLKMANMVAMTAFSRAVSAVCQFWIPTEWLRRRRLGRGTCKQRPYSACAAEILEMFRIESRAFYLPGAGTQPARYVIQPPSVCLTGLRCISFGFDRIPT